ncbi:hypothetical protein T12_16498 [Trichinella patagoniensis]|uniref:Uncharacterized protein n=1 Tax=Trichinella patagoniensis TaxID=990121 RepID=A0A0V1AAE3_9BILA|nr:hypothetical protein T12_16498 [Trichinella patagoniensis]
MECSKFGRFYHVDVVKNALPCTGSQSGSRHFNVPQLANGYDLNIGAKMQTQVEHCLFASFITPKIFINQKLT